jgi:hypothetical protein
LPAFSADSGLLAQARDCVFYKKNRPGPPVFPFSAHSALIISAFAAVPPRIFSKNHFFG